MRFLNEKEKARYMAAQELGLMDKVLSGGWAALTGAETGRIGGWISARNKRANMDKSNQKNGQEKA